MNSKLLVFLIILAALFLRFYNFPAWFGFDYDQEINAFIAKTILIDHKPVLIGPETSVGGMYVGPYFNYIISLFFLLGKMDPAWTILLNFLISFITIIAFYRVGKHIFGPTAGLVAIIIYGFSHFVISYDRVLWNPTPIPLVSLLAFYSLYRYLSDGKLKYLLLLATFLGFMIHLHLQAIFLIGYSILVLIIFRPKSLFNIKSFFCTLGIFFFFLAPLILFDLRHQFLNFQHFLAFFLKSSTQGVNFGLADFIKTLAIASTLLTNILAPFALLITIISGLFLFSQFTKNLFSRLTLILFLFSTILLSFYKGPLPTYYFFFLLPPFILSIAYFFSRLLAKNLICRIIATLLMVIFLSINIPPVLSEHSDLALKFKQQAVAYILSDAAGNPFTLDVVATPGLNTGFNYLFWQQGASLTLQTSKKYKLVIPESLAPPEELSARFGSIGVVKSN